MKYPLEWLKEYVPIKISTEKLAERMTAAGFEVESIEDTPAGIVFDVEVTPNRADCLSIVGMAREIAAFTGQPMQPKKNAQIPKDKPPLESLVRAASKKDTAIKIKLEDKDLCPRYIGQLFENIEIKPSPEWMQKRINACGTRAINNIVDITNYVLYEYGQPLHAFDYAKIADQTIHVRNANKNEKILALDELSYTLDADRLVIADTEKTLAIAGVMGGIGCETTESTTTLLLEAACFERIQVRRTSRALGLASESSYRFERGLDARGVWIAAQRAAQLIEELAGGNLVAVKEAGKKIAQRKSLSVSTAALNGWLGTDLKTREVQQALKAVGCEAIAKTKDILTVTPPSYRPDIVQAVDCYEEVARIIGYENIPSTIPEVALATEPIACDVLSQTLEKGGEPSPMHAQLTSLKCKVASLGLNETMNWALLPEESLTRIGLSKGMAIPLANPLSQDQAYLRPNLLIGLLSAVRRNLAHGAEGLRLFEVGSVFNKESKPAERQTLGLAIAGTWQRDWLGHSEASFIVLKGLIENLVQRLVKQPLELEPRPLSWALQGESVAVKIAGRTVGVLAQVDPQVLASGDIETPVWFAELDVPSLCAVNSCEQKITAPAVYPPVKRDLSILIDNSTTYADLLDAINSVVDAETVSVNLMDRYAGKKLPQGKYSITFNLAYRAADRTLTAEEAETHHQKIVSHLQDKFGAQLRG